MATGPAVDEPGLLLCTQVSMEKNESPTLKSGGAFYVLFGDVLLSHRVPPAVPSALKGLASGFGM
jgi:hypothetical protein